MLNIHLTKIACLVQDIKLSGSLPISVKTTSLVQKLEIVRTISVYKNC